MITTASDRFETVAIVYSQAELALLLSLLENRGIWTVLMSQGHISVQWDWTLALGGMHVRVRADDADAARSVLANVESRPFDGRLFTGSSWFDLTLALALLVATGVGVGVPARAPAIFLPATRTESS